MLWLCYIGLASQSRALINQCHFVNFFFNISISPFQAISYDHIELNFYINGKAMSTPFTGIKGSNYPVLYGKLIPIIFIGYDALDRLKQAILKDAFYWIQ